MYNRYIPQNDGTYRRNPVQQNNQQKKAEQHHQGHTPPPPYPQPCQPEITEPCRHNESAGGFLKGLLPKNLDTGDLLIIILLLLLAGDNEKDKNSALLTLALYLFM